VIEVALAILPAPLWVHSIEPLADVASVTVNVPLSHMLPVGEVIVAAGGSVTVITRVSVAAAHEPELVTVKVNVTELPPSAAPGV
jgi:hypothetical protein